MSVIIYKLLLTLLAALCAVARAQGAPRVPVPAAYEVVCADMRERGVSGAERVCLYCLKLEPGNPACRSSAPAGARKAPKRGAKSNLLQDLCVTSFQNGDLVKAADFCAQCLAADRSDASCFATKKLVQSRLPQQAPPPALQALPLPESRAANQHYLSGVVFFQSGDHAKALEEWKLCAHVEPGNADCAAGLKRLEAMGIR